MCLALPGRIVRMDQDEGGLAFADVAFGTASSRVCLVYTPEAEVGDYVIVHVGFAIQVLDERAAKRTLDLLDEVGP